MGRRSSGSERKRRTLATYNQDDTGVSYQTNPRVTESKVGDGTNTKRTTIDYVLYESSTIAAFGLPAKVKVYDTDPTTVLKQSDTAYNFDSNYISRRIAGLPVEVEVQGRNQPTSSMELVSRMTFGYDEGNFSDSGLQQTISPVQYDSTNFGSGFAYRGNLTSTTRWDATAPTTTSIVTSTLKSNTAGSVVAKITPWDGTNTRTVKIGYADNFNSSPGVSTYAYPTAITDPAKNSSTVKYRYDIGAKRRGNLTRTGRPDLRQEEQADLRQCWQASKKLGVCGHDGKELYSIQIPDQRHSEQDVRTDSRSGR